MGGDENFSADLRTEAAGLSRLGETASLNGELEAREDVVIAGKFKGKITLPSASLTILQGARVEADVQAKNVILHGEFIGRIQAKERVKILETAFMNGDITTAKIAVSAGAHFKGNITVKTL